MKKTQPIDKPSNQELALAKMLREVVDHADYCGWGDAWERACAHDCKLPSRAEDLLEKYGPYLETKS